MESISAWCGCPVNRCSQITHGSRLGGVLPIDVRSRTTWDFNIDVVIVFFVSKRCMMQGCCRCAFAGCDRNAGVAWCGVRCAHASANCTGHRPHAIRQLHRPQATCHPPSAQARCSRLKVSAGQVEGVSRSIRSGRSIRKSGSFGRSVRLKVSAGQSGQAGQSGRSSRWLLLAVVGSMSRIVMLLVLCRVHFSSAG